MYLANSIGKKIKSFFRVGAAKPNTEPYTKDVLQRSDCIIGEHTYGVPKILSYGEGKTLTIGKFCSISGEVKIFLGGNHRVDWVSTYPFTEFNDKFSNAVGITGHPQSKGNVVIGNDVWIGYGASIMSGIEIGDGAVIGAYAVVTKDVPPYSISVGNPAKVARMRFTDDIIKGLLKIKWWELPDKEINNLTSLLSNDDPSLLIKHFESL